LSGSRRLKNPSRNAGLDGRIDNSIFQLCLFGDLDAGQVLGRQEGGKDGKLAYGWL
jgi:hypothetical protein